MAVAPPVLTVKVEVDANSARLATQKAEAILLEGAAKAEAKRTQISTTGNEKRLQNEANALQKQKLSWEKHLNSIALAEEKARLKSLKGQESWSAKMTKSLDSVAFSIKAMAAAWVTAQLGSAIKGSLELAGGMRDLASGVNLTTQQYFALTSALRDAGVQAEKIDPMFTRLNELVSGGASAKQQTILDKLGINATGMSNTQLMDTLLGKINSRMITSAELGELVGNRVVPSWNRLANEIKNVNDAQARYKFPLTEEQVDTLDRAARAWDMMFTNISLGASKAFLDVANLFNFVANATPPKGGGGATQLSSLPAWMQQSLVGFPLVGSAGFMGQPTPSATPRGGDNGMPPRNPARPSAYGSGFGAGDDATLGGRYSPFLTGATMAVNVEPIRVMARELPTITRELENSSNFADTLASSIEKFGKSDTWQVANAGAQAFNSLLSMQATLIQNEVDALQMIMQMESQRWQERTRQAEAAGIASSAAFRNEAREHEKIEKQRQKKLKELQSKGWEQNKLSGISNTIMSTAQGVMQAFASPDLPAFTKLIMAGLVSATGAAQIAMISSQKNPYKNYAFGGYVPGQSLGDDTMINVTGGEFVNNRQSTQQNRAALEFANKGGIIKPDGMSGGITVIIQGDIVGDDAYVESRLIPRLQRAIDRGYKLRVNG